MLIFFGAASLIVNCAHAQGVTRRTRAIEFSETNNTDVLTKLHQLENSKEGATGPEEEWGNVFQYRGLSDQGGQVPGGTYVPQSTPHLPTRKMKDLLERQKNWRVTSEDVLTATGESWLKSSTSDPDDKDKDKNKSSLKQFSDAFERRGDPTAKSDLDSSDDDRDTSKKAGLAGPDLSTLDDPSLPSSLRDTTRQLSKILSDDSGKGDHGNRDGHSTFDDFFGLGHGPSPKELEAQKASIAKYRNDVLGSSSMFSPSGSPSNPLLNPLAPADPAAHATYLGGLGSLNSTLKPEGTALPANTTFSSLASPGMPDINTKTVNSWNPFYTPPQELPKVTPLSMSPSPFDFPRRKF
jgi:hypothetical protein